MELSYLQGKAAAIAALEVDRAMSIFQIPGPIAAIKEIKVGPIKGKIKKTCTVKVVFSKDLQTEIAFKGEAGIVPIVPDHIHWTVGQVVTYYCDYDEPYKSERTY